MSKNYISTINNSNFNKFFEGIDFGMEDEFTEVNNSDNNMNRCPECKNDKLIEDQSQGTVVCCTCGHVLDQILDYNPEWKQYEDTENNARCGGEINTLLPLSSTGTSIAGHCKSRIKVIHGWQAMPYKERSLHIELKKIQDICQKNNILKCAEIDAQFMYKMASECKHKFGKNAGKYIITRGINRVSISAACVYFACIKRNMTYTAKEIAEYYGITLYQINKGIKNLRKLLIDKEKLKSDVSLPSQFIRRYCNNLQILTKHTDEAIKIATIVENMDIASEHNSYSLAAACILLVSDIYKLKHVTRKKLAAEFDISDVTINKTFKKIEIVKDIYLNNEQVEKKDNTEIISDNDIPDEIVEKMKLFGVITPDEPHNIHINIDEDYKILCKINDFVNTDL